MGLDYAWHDYVGNFGVLLIVGSYFLLQTGHIVGASMGYSALNGLGAALVLISLVFDFNLSAFVIEVFWLLISLLGIVRSFRSRGGRSA